MARRGANRAAKDSTSLVISDTATLKAVADPLRHQLLTLLTKPRTVRELADATGRAPDRLYYHLRILEDRGLVRAVQQRGAERRYEPTADQITIDPKMAMAPSTVDGLISGMLQHAQREYSAAVRRKRAKGGRKTMLGLRYVLLDDGQWTELAERMQALLSEYEAVEGNDAVPEDGRKVFGVLQGVWPVDEPAG